jgi:hypothetical protein
LPAGIRLGGRDRKLNPCHTASIDTKDPVPNPQAPGLAREGQAAPPEEGTGAKPAAPVLTPEEQMALFEKELKENDWGHQPC